MAAIFILSQNNRQDDEMENIRGINRVGRWICNHASILVAISAKLIAILIMVFPVFDMPSANRCLAIIVFTVIMLVSHSIPLFATALLVPVLLVTGRVLGRIGVDGQWRALGAKEAADRVLPIMFGPMIPVLLASCVIAACYRKYDVLSALSFGKSNRSSISPIARLALSMLTTALLCFFLSNISAVIIVYALISGHIFSSTGNGPSLNVQKALLVGIAMAGSIGGLFSPVSSTQSIFAFTAADPSLKLTWQTWLAASIPVVVLSLSVGIILVAAIYDLFKTKSPKPVPPPIFDEAPSSPDTINADRPTRLKLIWILFVTVATVALWALIPLVESRLGNIAIVSFLPIIALFASRVLLVADLALLPWDIILLDMGALALVEGARSSGLIFVIIATLDRHMSHLESTVQPVIICAVVMTISTFSSHTVTGLLVPPIMNALVQHRGLISGGPAALAEGRAIYLAATFATSIGMGLPFSSLVNLSMFGVTNRAGQRIPSTWDFALVGFPLSLICYGLVVLIVPPLVRAI